MTGRTGNGHGKERTPSTWFSQVLARQSTAGRLPGRTAASIVFLAAILVFAGTLGHGLVWDDPDFIGYAVKVVEEGGLGALATAEFKPDLTAESATGYYRPVVLLSLWIDEMLGASSPLVFHLTNILLHALCSVLVFVLLSMLLSSDAGALGGALLFALHPVHVESVAFVSGRTDLFAALFCLAAAVYWLRVRQGISANPFRDRILSAAAFSLACLSKEVSLVLPAILLAWDFLLPDNVSVKGEFSWRRRSWLLDFAAVAVGIILWRHFILDIGFGREVVSGQSSLSVPHKAPEILLAYIRLLFLPIELRPVYWARDFGASWGGISLLVLLTGLLVFFLVKKAPRTGLAGLVWTSLFLLPVSGIVKIHGAPLAERFLYLPSAGFCLLVGCAWGVWYNSSRKIFPVVTGVLLLSLMAAGSYSYSRVWKDNVTLYTEMIIKEPGSVIGYFNIGNVYYDLGRVEGAEWAFMQAMTVEPRFVGSYINLLGLYLGTGKCEEASDLYQAVLERFAGKPDDLFRLVPVLGQYGLDEAADETIRQIGGLDERMAARALSILSSKAVIDTTCSRAGWPAP